VTYESKEAGELEPKGGSSTTTWRTSSTAYCGCQLDAAAGTYQAQQARPGRARKVPAATLLHVGIAAATLLLYTALPPRFHRGRHWSEQADPSRPRWACMAQIWAIGSCRQHPAAPPVERRRDATNNLEPSRRML
jgi:hypothetical protein